MCNGRHHFLFYQQFAYYIYIHSHLAWNTVRNKNTTVLKVTFWVWSFIRLVDWKSTGPRGQITGHLFVCVSLCMQLYVFFVLLGPWPSDITASPVSVFDRFPPNNDCNDYWHDCIDYSVHCTFGYIKILPQFTSLEKVRRSWNNTLHAKNLNSAIMHPTITSHVKLRHSAAISK